MPYLIDSDVVINHLANVPTATTLLEQLAFRRNCCEYYHLHGSLSGSAAKAASDPRTKEI